ncbi:hypothetical protein V1523DRAFT_420897, partial [Lipomyces doorenjongii]
MESSSLFSIQLHPQKSTRPPNSRKTFLPSLITSDGQQRTEGGSDKTATEEGKEVVKRGIVLDLEVQFWDGSLSAG